MSNTFYCGMFADPNDTFQFSDGNEGIEGSVVVCKACGRYLEESSAEHEAVCAGDSLPLE